MEDFPRLIEHGFPLRETSLASVHEKNVRHGHISTLHIWPARRPLAACRAALIATLLPDPGDPKKRADIFERLAGTVPDNAASAKDIVGGILRWGNESRPELQWFRDEIRKAYGGRAPRVLDPFAGGGAIPLEAMRLGCETTAIDINPVAWFVLKCTLEYPQRFAGKVHPLPAFTRSEDRSPRLGLGESQLRDLAAHVRLWGDWVFERARLDLASYYPIIDGKQTVAYLWARTVRCKNCRATIPLLKTRWLCKTAKNAVVLTMTRKGDDSGVDFEVAQLDRKQRVRYDASGTMNSSGVRCPSCPAQMTMAELRIEGKAQRMGTMMTAVVVDGANGKEYRSPLDIERERADTAAGALAEVFSDIPFGLPTEPLPSAEALGFRVPLYGIDRWDKLFTPRQLLALGTFVKYTRALRIELQSHGYDALWIEAIVAQVAVCVDKLADYGNMCCSWFTLREQIAHMFVRFALPIAWDFVETSPFGGASGSWRSMIEFATKVLDKLESAYRDTPDVTVTNASALVPLQSTFDVVVTDPPYYDAVPYSDLMDVFYIWLKRMLYDLSPEFERAFSGELSPKWDRTQGDGELIDDSSRFDGNATASRLNYEHGMEGAFRNVSDHLASNGRMVVVFANKNPAAWEALVSAVICAGFVVDASWPIITEMRGGVRNFGRASLASSIWLVCKKRDVAARPGWDSTVRDEMRTNVSLRLREYWDAGIRGPDFVWSAIGPALEAFSKYPRVRKVESPDESLTVSDFLTEVRREVVGFAAARVLHRSEDEDSGIDGLTTYYLLHRNDFQFEPVPVGASILYAVSCNLRDSTLIDEYDLLLRPGRAVKMEPLSDSDGELDDDAPLVDIQADAADTRPAKADKSVVQLKEWNERKRPSLGEDVLGRPAALIDQIHRLMRLWKSGDVSKVNDYVAARGLSSDRRAREVIQAIIELAERASEERSILEAISNHLGDARAPAEAVPALFT
jgi:putative DNA methylase